MGGGRFENDAGGEGGGGGGGGANTICKPSKVTLQSSKTSKTEYVSQKCIKILIM